MTTLTSLRIPRLAGAIALLAVTLGMLPTAARADLRELSKTQLASAVRSTQELLIVQMTASWCVNCHLVKRYLLELSAEHGSELSVAQLDVGRHASAFSTYDLRAVPTVLVFRGGREVERHVGVPSREWLAQAVARHAAPRVTAPPTVLASAGVDTRIQAPTFLAQAP